MGRSKGRLPLLVFGNTRRRRTVVMGHSYGGPMAPAESPEPYRLKHFGINAFVA